MSVAYCANPPCITPTYNSQNLTKRSLQQSTLGTSDNFSKVLKRKSFNTPNLSTPNQKTIVKNLGINNNKIRNASIAKDGTNLAIKELAVEMEQQFLGIMWNSAFAASGQNFEGGLGEEIFSGELTNEIVKSSQGDKMSDIAQRIYDEAIEVYKVSDGN